MAYVEKYQLEEIFQDTKNFYESDETLKSAVQKSVDGTKFYGAEDYPPLPAKKFDKTLITVTQGRTFETAMSLHKNNVYAKIAVHNFASATNPGGGVLHGSRAQEESLCRCSTLYPALDTDENWSHYYNFHVDLPQRLPRESWVTVDVMTCAAPNLRYSDLSDKELLKIHEMRGRHMLTILAHHGAEIFVTGAFGCGAFKNNPKVVAQAYKNILPDFNGYFKEIVFAIYCTPREMKNFDSFKKILG